jgi:hypothetical protein
VVSELVVGATVRTKDGRIGTLRAFVDIPARKGKPAYQRAEILFPPTDEHPTGYVQFNDLDGLTLEAQGDLFADTPLLPSTPAVSSSGNHPI